MISEGEAIYYIEYLDHLRSSDLERIDKKPFQLWCCGKIAKDSNGFIAVICSGAKDEIPNTQPTYEIILKSAITKKELIHVV